MAGFNEYTEYDGLGLAELMTGGQVSPDEVLEAALERIGRLNPRLNAVITPMYDRARQSLAQGLPQGPFSGVPFFLKDLMAAYAGVPLSSGCKALKDYIPVQDSELVRRFKASGVLILGKTNTPEFGLMGITEPEAWGPCRNPWNLEHTPGGSSGGSAAAVAAGLAPLASAGDGGGSIRIPAACCGLFGLKPSRGRNPTGPQWGRVWQGAVQEHVITRSVRDSAAMLDLVSGPDVGAPYVIAPPVRPYIKELDQDPAPLRIAFTSRSPMGGPTHAQATAAVEDAARLLAELGHQVEEDETSWEDLPLAKSYLIMYFGEMAAEIKDLAAHLGRRARPGDVEPLTWTLAMLGRATSAGELVEALRVWDRAARRMGRFFQKHDLLLTPTLAFPPARVGELGLAPGQRAVLRACNTLRLGGLLKALGITDQMAGPSLEKTPFTQLANLTGLPAMSVPLYWTPQGLPLGCQVMAPFGGEATLLALAGQLERARPWFSRRPSLD